MKRYKLWITIEEWDDASDRYRDVGVPMGASEWVDSEAEAYALQLAHATDAERESERALDQPKCMIIDPVS